MTLAFIEHFLIQSADIEVTKDWWCNVLLVALVWAQ